MVFRAISKNIRWDKEFCKLCDLCVNFCPKKTLKIVDNKMTESGRCIRCRMCERNCPDLAIEVINNEKTIARK